MTNEERDACPYCRYQAEIEWSPAIAELRAELRAAVNALRKVRSITGDLTAGLMSARVANEIIDPIVAAYDAKHGEGK